MGRTCFKGIYIYIYELGTEGRINWTEVCNSKRESSHVRLSKQPRNIYQGNNKDNKLKST